VQGGATGNTGKVLGGGGKKKPFQEARGGGTKEPVRKKNPYFRIQKLYWGVVPKKNVKKVRGEERLRVWTEKKGENNR